MLANPMIDKQVPEATGFRLTGLKVLAILLLFFGTIMIVNFLMAYLAIHTFSGMQTDKPYETGLAFNHAIADAQAQDARGWSVSAAVERAPSGTVTVKATLLDAAKAPLSGYVVTATLRSPIDAKRDHTVALSDDGEGLYHGEITTEAGQWDLEILALLNDKSLFRSVNRVILH
jgi:nitrogen fixation protein FixH